MKLLPSQLLNRYAGSASLDGLISSHECIMRRLYVIIDSQAHQDIVLILVVGSGMIGLLTIQAAKAAGITRVFAVDLEDSKLELARSLGADETFNPKNCDPVKEIQARTNGRGADIAFEAVGATEPVKMAIAATRKGGTVTLIGNITPNIDLNLQSVVTREIRLQGTCGSCGEYPACLDLLSRGLIKVDPFISAKVPLAEGEEWFQKLYKHEPGLMKVILQP